MEKQKLETIIGKDLYERAKEVLENPDYTEKWFYTPGKAFNGKTPLEIYHKGGVQDIYDLLGRIEDGVYS